jgi:hypothetical protein
MVLIAFVDGHSSAREGGSALRLQFTGLVRRTPKAALPAYQQVGGQVAGSEAASRHPNLKGENGPL